MSVQLHSPATGEPGNILGFAERADGGLFEVLQLGHGHGIARLRFDSLQSVVDHFSRLV